MSFTSHMIASLKHNKRTPISAFEKIKNFKEGINIQISFKKKATVHQLKSIKEKLQAEHKRTTRRNRIVLVTIIIILVYVIGFVKF